MGVGLSTALPSEHQPPRFLQDVVFHGKLKVGPAVQDVAAGSVDSLLSDVKRGASAGAPGSSRV